MAELKAKKNNASVTQFLNFSPRAKNLTTYIMPGFSAYGKLLKKLGKHTTGNSVRFMKRKYGVGA